MNKKKENIHLKEYIDKLTEESLGSIFVDPITSIFKTAAFSLENAVAATKGLIKGILYQIPTLLIPGLKFNYDQFKIDQENKMQEIEKKYGDTLKKVFDGLKSRDLWGMSFLLFPEMMLAQKLLFAAPSTALNALEIISGGHPALTSIRQRWSSTVAPLPMPNDPNGGWSGGSGGAYGGDYGGGNFGDYGGGSFGESKNTKNKTNLFEDQQIPQQVQQNPNSQLIAELQALLKDPSFQQKLNSSPILRDIKLTGINMWKDRINAISAIKSLDDPKLNSMFGNTGFVNKIKNELNIAIQKDQNLSKDPEKKKQAIVAMQDAALKEIKSKYKEFYYNELQKLAQITPQIQDEVNLIINQTKNV